jgi:hypothetical protein
VYDRQIEVEHQTLLVDAVAREDRPGAGGVDPGLDNPVKLDADHQPADSGPGPAHLVAGIEEQPAGLVEGLPGRLGTPKQLEGVAAGHHAQGHMARIAQRCAQRHDQLGQLKRAVRVDPPVPVGLGLQQIHHLGGDGRRERPGKLVRREAPGAQIFDQLLCRDGTSEEGRRQGCRLLFHNTSWVHTLSAPCFGPTLI